MTRPPPPPEESWRPPLRASRGDDAEVSWLGVKARGRLPNPSGSVASAAGSPLTVAGAAPVSHRTSLSHRVATLSRRRADWQRARLTRRAVHRNDPPAMPHAGAVDMVDASDRAVFHREGEAGFGFEPEREAQRRADRAAMRDGDDVAPAMDIEHKVNGAGDPLHHVDKALAAGRPLLRRGVPEAVKGAAARLAQLLIGQPLPLAEILLGQIGDRLGLRARDRVGARQTGAHDRPRGLVRAPQIA